MTRTADPVKKLHEHDQNWMARGRTLLTACAGGIAGSAIMFLLLDRLMGNVVATTFAPTLRMDMVRWLCAIAAAIVGGAITEYFSESWQEATSAIIALAVTIQLYDSFTGVLLRAPDRQYISTAVCIFVSARFGHCLARCVYRVTDEPV